jgi:hypothetical protein
MSLLPAPNEKVLPTMKFEKAEVVLSGLNAVGRLYIWSFRFFWAVRDLNLSPMPKEHFLGLFVEGRSYPIACVIGF